MSNKLKVGIFFGGPSREREISFRGGKTAFEHIDKSLFEPIPIFVDSLGNFIEMESKYLYEESIRDFYPSKNLNNGYRVYIESLGNLNDTQLYKLIYKIGKQIKTEKLAEKIDFAFNVLHGPYGEDGGIQGLLEWLRIPYMGPGLLGSAIGIEKSFQNMLLNVGTGQKKKSVTISKKQWVNADKSELFSEMISEIGFPLVVKAPHQGSSIGVAIVKKRSLEEFTKCMQQCYFELIILKKDWSKLTRRQKKNLIDKMASLNEGIGFPVQIKSETVFHPANLLRKLDDHFKENDQAILTSSNGEDYVVIEEFIEGTEFSMGVIQDDDFNTFALPPTEIYAEGGNFDYKSKYQTNTTKKRIPIDTSLENLYKVEQNILTGFKFTGMSVISRIDGFITPKNEIILHDPNTVPGMSPTSLIFKQMVEVGINITQSITYLIRQSIIQRRKEGKGRAANINLLKKLDNAMVNSRESSKKSVAILFGENTEDYEQARSKYTKMAASEEYDPTCICAAKNGKCYIIPISRMFKADIMEFGQSIAQGPHPFIAELTEKVKHIRERYAGDVNFNVLKIDREALSSTYDKIYDVASEKFLET